MHSRFKKSHPSRDQTNKKLKFMVFLDFRHDDHESFHNNGDEHDLAQCNVLCIISIYTWYSRRKIMIITSSWSPSVKMLRQREWPIQSFFYPTTTANLPRKSIPVKNTSAFLNAPFNCVLYWGKKLVKCNLLVCHKVIIFFSAAGFFCKTMNVASCKYFSNLVLRCASATLVFFTTSWQLHKLLVFATVFSVQLHWPSLENETWWLHDKRYKAE